MRQEQSRRKTPAARILSLALALCMIAAFVPAFTLTAGAVGAITVDDTTLIYDTTALATDSTWFAFEFELGAISSFKDFGFVDADGYTFAGACDAWFSGDGFYVADGERSLTLGSDFERTSSQAVGNIKYNTYGDGAMVRAVVVKDTSEGTYSVTYYVVVDSTATSFGTVYYTSSTGPNGIALPDQWDYTGSGSGVTASTSGTAFDNFTVYAGDDADNITFDDTTLVYSPDTVIDTSAYEYYVFEFDLGAISSFKDFGFVDADGYTFAGACDAWFSGDGFYVADGERSLTLGSDFERTSSQAVGNIKYNTYGAGATVRAVVEKDTTEGTYSVTYYVVVDSTATSFGTVEYTSEAGPNGIAVPAGWNYGGSGSGVTATNANYAFENFKVYAGNYPASTNTVTVTYTAGTETAKTETITYDADTYPSGYTFSEYYYSVDGANTLYYAAEQTLSEDTEIAMTALGNPDVSSYAKDGVIEDDGTQYTITSDNLIPNGDFTYGLNGWFNGLGNTPTSSYFTVNSDGTITSVQNNGNGTAASICRSWAIESGKTYLLTYTDTMSSGDANYRKVSLAAATGTAETSVINAASTGDTALVFTNSDGYAYVKVNFRWLGTDTFGNFGLYELEENTDASATVTVEYQVDGTTVTSATKTVVKGNTASFDAISNYVYNGKYYSADALSYESVSEDATYYVELEVDDSKYAPTSDFSYNFYTNEVIWAGDNGFTSSDAEATISIGWNNLRQTIMTFDVSDLLDDDTLIESAVLNMNIGYKNVADYVIAAIDPSFVDTETPSMYTTSYSWTYSDISTALSTLSAVTVASGTSSTGWNAITLDLSNANDLIDEDGTLALFIYTDNTTYGQFYTYSATSDYPPYLDSAETTTAVTYTVKYVDTEGNALDNDGTYSTTYDNTIGYDDEVIVPYVTIPYFTGYIFTS
ncbi:MAG: hypothetical protein LUG52_00340, partial [Clostridia bacterium]|nr:hypothetical protein [Clostridia bacterium]